VRAEVHVVVAPPRRQAAAACWDRRQCRWRAAADGRGRWVAAESSGSARARKTPLFYLSTWMRHAPYGFPVDETRLHASVVSVVYENHLQPQC
jgi:hypothetical protein